ncbi:transcription initiation factor TFIID subunit 11 isoform X1 [Camponotus floridanus]|uniref:transcription initiation factor TFIID subunit 11 isoform X1 n=1 Tax=Camponotus floridanus TaxID=104421 RepID=UPI000DC6677C|nr:transcription initiation factor TFIID subunit 11 isoform X1 [Camponotus floridanus]
MATKYESSSSTTTKKTPKNYYVCSELKFLQVVMVQSSLGQTILKLMNNFLWTVEKCAEWSLSDQEIDLDEDENKKKSGLVRPLPWILFLPSLIILRILRMTVNAGALLIGYSQVTPSGLVKFLQISRKRLNDVKKSGMKEKQNKDERSSMNEARKALIKSIRLTLSSLSCLDMSKPTPSPPPTKIHVSSVLDPDAPTTTTSEEKSATESTDATEKQENLTSCSESSSSEDEKNEEEETLKEKIDRLALESSDEDEDFDPADCSSSSIDKSNEEDDDDNVNDGNVSSTELCDIVKEANVLFNRTTAMQNEIEKFQASERAAAQVCDQRLLAEESRDKVEEHLLQSTTIDSPTCCTPDRSSQEGDSIFYSPISSDSDKASIAEKCVSRDSLKANKFANDEIHFISTSMISETSKTSGETNNGAIVEKRSTNVSKCHKGKRTSHGNRKKK